MASALRSGRMAGLVLPGVVALGLLPAIGAVWRFWLANPAFPWLPGGRTLAVRDYLWLWGAGRFLARGDVAGIFDPAGFAASLRAAFGAGLAPHMWSYPPSMLFLAWPAGWIGPVPGAILYAAAQAGLLGLLARGLGGGEAWLLLLAPALWESALGGQNGGLTGALLAGGLLALPRAPVFAGVLFGLLTVKPQLGLLVPVCLLATGQWRAIAAAAASAAALFAASLAAFGWIAWEGFWTRTRPLMQGVLTQAWDGDAFQRIMVSPFMLLRWAGIGVAPALGAQALCSAACLWLVWRVWRDPRTGHAMRVAITLALTPLATPYAYTYDGVAVAVAVLLAWRACAAGPAAFAAWAWPGWALPLSVLAGCPPLGAAIHAAFAAALWRHRTRETKP